MSKFTPDIDALVASGETLADASRSVLQGQVKSDVMAHATEIGVKVAKSWTTAKMVDALVKSIEAEAAGLPDDLPADLATESITLVDPSDTTGGATPVTAAVDAAKAEKPKGTVKKASGASTRAARQEQHTHCPDCGFAFPKPQAKCQSATACAKRAAAKAA
jgi:hypothetical protein